MRRKLNVAMIGYDFMGRAHSNAWRQVGPVFSPALSPVMKVVCGRSEDKVKEAAARLGWEEHATSWEEVIERDDIDLVDICTPGDSHKEIAVAAARAGKAILCEKPLANRVDEAREMLDAVNTAGVVHMVCHNYRRVPAVSLARQWIEEGRLGEIRHYRGTYLQDWIVDPDFPRVWRLEKSKAGSGALGDIASHSIDLARYLVGEISEVCGLLAAAIISFPTIILLMDPCQPATPHTHTPHAVLRGDADVELVVVPGEGGVVGLDVELEVVLQSVHGAH